MGYLNTAKVYGFWILCVLKYFHSKELKQKKALNPKFLKGDISVSIMSFIVFWLIASNHCANQSPAVSAHALTKKASLVLLDHN